MKNTPNTPRIPLNVSWWGWGGGGGVGRILHNSRARGSENLGRFPRIEALG